MLVVGLRVVVDQLRILSQVGCVLDQTVGQETVERTHGFAFHTDRVACPVAVAVDSTHLRAVEAAGCVGIVTAGSLVVDRVAHLLHLVADGRTRQASVEREVLRKLLVVAHGKLEALVLNLTVVGIDRGEAGRRTNLLNQQQVLGVLHEVVERDVPVVQECEVQTDVGHLGGLPLQVGVHQRSKPTGLACAVTPVA